MRETIQLVMAAEKRASDLVDAARREGEARLADCRRRARDLADRVQRETRAEIEGILARAVEEAQREKEERLRAACTEIETALRLREEAAQRAVDAMVRCVVQGNDRGTSRSVFGRSGP